VGGTASHGDSKTPIKLERFVEKPNLERANEFLRSGGYLWNAGMFVWRVDVILREFARLMPEMDAAWNKADGNVSIAYPLMTATSIDYGILEKSPSVVTFRLTCGWDDLGSWTSLESMADRMGTRHEVGVVLEGQIVSVRSKNNIIDAPGKTVSLLDVEGMIIAQHGENLLVAKKESAQDLRLIVDSIKKTHPDLA
jgi:mannose-1-phosphate guanylyltransferase